LQAHRAAAVLFDDRGEKAAIEAIESARIDAFEVERGPRHRFRHLTARLDLRVVAHAAQQPVDDARGAPGPPRDLRGARGVDGRAEDARRARHDADEISLRVEIEMVEDPEALA